MATAQDQDVESSQAPLIEHLTELRVRLIRSLVALVFCIIICFVFVGPLFQIIVHPFVVELTERDLPARIITTGVQEKFLSDLKLALYCGLFIAFPLIANQLWRFVAPGLYQNEKKAFWPFLVATPILFALGGAMVYFIVSPLTFGFFLDYTAAGSSDGKWWILDWLGIEPVSETTGADISVEQRVSEYVSLMLTLIFAFGLAFQLPVLLTLLGRAGLASADGLARGRKYAIVAIAAAAAILTPPDFFSQIGLGVPMYFLYEISILLVRSVERKREEQLRADGYYDED